MVRNMKKEYIRKLMNLDVPNGYIFDLANYIYNPSADYDYPSFAKVISESDGVETIRRVYYFKHYDGEGEYIAETHTNKKGATGWQIIRDAKQEALESSRRFNINKLLTFCV